MFQTIHKLCNNFCCKIEQNVWCNLINISKYFFTWPTRFETSDGTARQEEGIIKNLGTDNEILSVTGAISWIGPDGETYTINFIADENGYQPVLGGAHATGRA